MNLKFCTVTFMVDDIFDISINLFVDAISNNNEQLISPYHKTTLFSFYEQFISYPIEDLKEGNDEETIDFYETISLMSWSLYKLWARKVVDENYQLNCFSDISKSDVVSLFIDNLNCNEGQQLLNKLQ